MPSSDNLFLHNYQHKHHYNYHCKYYRWHNTLQRSTYMQNHKPAQLFPHLHLRLSYYHMTS